jgi:hypothetical protein
MYKLPIFAFNEKYKSYSVAAYMLNFLKDNMDPCGGYAFSDYTKGILVTKFNCQYENQASPHVGLHYLEFSKEQDCTFFLLRFS